MCAARCASAATRARQLMLDARRYNRITTAIRRGTPGLSLKSTRHPSRHNRESHSTAVERMLKTAAARYTAVLDPTALGLAARGPVGPDARRAASVGRIVNRSQKCATRLGTARNIAEYVERDRSPPVGTGYNTNHSHHSKPPIATIAAALAATTAAAAIDAVAVAARCCPAAPVTAGAIAAAAADAVRSGSRRANAEDRSARNGG